jgi:serine/threonine-protein kinase
LHRDFKSDNVMLRSEAGAEISPLILDFGLARALDQESRAGGSSGNPTLLGTFGYIAPEQLEARPHSKASDVYAFGIVWFEMLTGELPFESSSSPALAVLERLKRDAPAPSSRNPQVPRDLDEIVLGCLRKSPTDRYRTAGEVLAALDAIDSRARPPISRRKLITLAGAIVLGGVSAYWALSTPPKSLPPVAAMAIFSSASQTPAVAALPQGLASAAAPKGAASAGSLLSEAAGHRVPNEMLALKPAGSRTHRPTPDPPQAQQQPAPVASLATAAPPIAVPTTKSPAWEDPFSQHSADGG